LFAVNVVFGEEQKQKNFVQLERINKKTRFKIDSVKKTINRRFKNYKKTLNRRFKNYKKIKNTMCLLCSRGFGNNLNYRNPLFLNCSLAIL